MVKLTRRKCGLSLIVAKAVVKDSADRVKMAKAVVKDSVDRVKVVKAVVNKVDEDKEAGVIRSPLWESMNPSRQNWTQSDRN
jgi:hypothetical protein